MSVFIFLVLISIFYPASVFAQNQSLSVSPIIINVPLSPGKTYTHKITIQNQTNSPYPLRAVLNDFQTTGEEGGYSFSDTKTNPLLSWVSLDNSEMILNPKERKTITLTIKTPRTIPLGGYYGMLFFEPVISGNNTESTLVTSKIGVLLLANIGVPDPKAKNAEILTYSTGLLHEKGMIPLLLRVKNTSLHYFTAKPSIILSPLVSLEKLESAPIYIEEKIIFQGKIRRWEQTLDLSGLKPNIYKARMRVSTGNGQFIEEVKHFAIFPFKKIASVALPLLLIIAISAHRKRLKKAILALISRP